MGFFRKRILDPLTQGPSIADGVPGQAQVVSSTSPHTTATGQARYKKCHLHLVVQAEGIAPVSVEHTQICPVSKWPRPGTTVPVVVSRSDPRRLTIDFDRIPDGHEVARAAAQQQAAFLRGEAPPPVPVVGDDRVDRLERLARLHASGALTDDEFAAEKRRLLAD